MPGDIQRIPRKENPMFIKLDKYHDTLSTVNDLKQFTQNLKYVFDIAEQADAIRSDAIRILRASINRTERAIQEIDAGLVKPSGWQPEHKMNTAQLSLERLRAQLARLKKDLEYFGSESRKIQADFPKENPVATQEASRKPAKTAG